MTGASATDILRRRPPQDVHPIDVKIGVLMRERREALRLSRRELGERAGLSCHQIEKYETGRNRIGASQLAGIARHLGVEPTWFFDQLGTPHETTPDERRVADAFARIDKPAVRASFMRLLETMALQSATWTPQSSLPRTPGDDRARRGQGAP